MAWIPWIIAGLVLSGLAHLIYTMNRRSVPLDHRFYGHPRGLATLFFTEMWERFSYYGMRAILLLFMTTAVLEGGLGFSAERAAPIYAMYTSLVYLSTVPGGWLADNFLGQRHSVLYGGIAIMAGHILLAMHGLAFFYSGLLCVIVGTGLLKANISVIVGQLYTEKDRRRDAGFSIFYMGINIGAFSSPFVCGWLAQSERFREMLKGWGMDPVNAWHWGFAAAAVGMGLGLIQYLWTGHHLGDAGMRPHPPRNETVARRNRLVLRGSLALVVVAAGSLVLLGRFRPALLNQNTIHNAFNVFLGALCVLFFGKLFLDRSWTPFERARLFTIFVLFCGAAIFWGIFEQAGSTLTLFADRSTRNSVFGYEFPSSWWQSVNALFIIALAPVFAWLWVALRDHEPSSPTKFALGLFFAGAGFAVLIGGARFAGEGGRVSPLWLLSVYLLHTIGELCLSPVGLSAMTKLAPMRVVSLMMGVWFLAASVGNYLAGSVAGYYEKLELPTLLGYVAASGIVMSLIMFALVIPIRRMLQRAEAETPQDAQGSGSGSH